MRTIATLTALLFLCATPAFAQDPPSEETIDFFAVNCASCHTIGGGRITGPDLKGVDQRQERDWLTAFIRDPKAVIDSGDPYAAQLLREAKGSVMPTLTQIDDVLAGKLFDLIVAESAKEKSMFLGLQISDRPLTPDDVTDGRALFLGEKSFLAGGPACVSCHTVAGLGALGGGTLGPDLTSVFSRLEGRKALSAWLSSPPSAVMQPVFTRAKALDTEEILALVAFLKDTAEGGELEAAPSILNFILAGVGLAAVLMVLFDIFWRERFRSVRRTLVANN